MHLDETILQSRTAIQLAEIIDELFTWIPEPTGPYEAVEDYNELENKVNYIKTQTAKAAKKRSFK